MLKKFVSSLLAVVLLAGCGGAGTSSTAAVDASGTAEKIVKDLGLTEKMDKIEDKIVTGLFFFGEGTVTSSAVYIANDKTADLVGVFEVTDLDATKTCIETYLKSQKEQMQSYYPDEVFKLDNAIIEDNGNEIIVVVCEDIEKAQTEVNSILGK